VAKNNEIYAEVISRGQTMRGMVHRPADFSPSRRYPAIMMWHGFTGARVEPHRLFVKTARRLASEGFIVARFDFVGSGESDGEYVDVTPETEIADALTVIQWINGQPGVDRTKLALIGLSLGGLVSACAAARSGNIAALCLWAATASIMRSLGQRVTPEAEAFLAQHGWVDWYGTVVGQGFFNSAARVDPLQELQKYRGEALILHGDADPTVSLDHAEDYHRALPQSTLHIIKGADHTFNRMDWEKELIETTAQWLKLKLSE
jgi:dipeptidyl aminopeptidase/acylaminoacyl peptidase